MNTPSYSNMHQQKERRPSISKENPNIRSKKNSVHHINYSEDNGSQTSFHNFAFEHGSQLNTSNWSFQPNHLILLNQRPSVTLNPSHTVQKAQAMISTQPTMNLVVDQQLSQTSKTSQNQSRNSNRNPNSSLNSTSNTPNASRGGSNASSRKPTPEKKAGVNLSTKMNTQNPYLKSVREINDLENISIHNSNNLVKENNPKNTTTNLKKKMQLNLIRTAYDRRSSSNNAYTKNGTLTNAQGPLHQIDENCTQFSTQIYHSLAAAQTGQSTTSQFHQSNNKISAHTVSNGTQPTINNEKISRPEQYQQTYTPNSANKNRTPGKQVVSATPNHNTTKTLFDNKRQINRMNYSLNVSLNSSHSGLHNNNINPYIPLKMNGSIENRNSQQKDFRIDTSLMNLDDSINNETSFYERSTPFELNKFLPHHMASILESSKGCHDKSFDSGFLNTSTQFKVIPKQSSHQYKSEYQSKQSSQINDETNQLLEKGQSYFKNSNLIAAIQCFSEALKKDEGNLELHYLLGVCYLGRGEYERASKEFLFVIEKNPLYRKNIYLLLSIAFKKLNNIPGAIRMLCKVLSTNPEYYDAYIYRGKLYIKEKKWEKAESDFDHAIQLQPQKGLAYIGKADCLRFLNNFSEAIAVYTKALQFEPSLKGSTLLKRAITQIDHKQYESSLRDLQEVLIAEPSNSEAFYYKGLVYYKQKNFSDAILNFEQSIKYNNSKKAVTKSLYEIAKIKIEKRDFYQALHTLNRSEYLDTDKKILEKFRLFTEGVIFLMKRKFKEGIDNFNLITENFNLGEFLKPLFYVYRAYGLFCLGKHASAVQDYHTIEGRMGDSNSEYNVNLCQGILAITNSQYDRAVGHFESAMKIFPAKMEPFFYKGVQYIHKAFRLHQQDQSQMTKVILEGLSEIDKAVEKCQTNAQLYYCRAIIRSYLGYHQDGVSDIDKAIEKSEDNVPMYFYFRGHNFACCKQYKQAIYDLSIAIQTDDSFADAYLERSKCYHFNGESNNAFADLQKFISLKPQDPSIHKWAGNLLFNNAAYEDAILAYSHSDQIEFNPQLLLLRAQCRIIVKDLYAAYSDIVKITEINSSPSYTFDRGCLSGLVTVLQQQKNSRSAHEHETCFQNGLSKLQKLNQFVEGGQIFNFHDLALYKGVLQFYCGQYEESIKSYFLSLQLRQKVQKQRKANESKYSNETENQDTQTIENASQLEIQYNIALSYLMMNKLGDSLEILTRFEQVLQDHMKPALSVLVKLIQSEFEQKKSSVIDSIDDKIRNEFLSIFLGEGRLSELFPPILAPFTFAKNILLRPSFDIPVITPPSLHPTFQVSLMENMSASIVENKPEAPWIRRNQSGVMFTDNIQIFDDLDLETEEKDKNEKDRQIEIDRMKAKLMLDKDIEDKLKNMKQSKRSPQINS